MSEIFVFYLLSAIIILTSILVVTMKDIFRAAIALMLMFVTIAGVYITLGAEFLAAVQVLVYAGAVMILILFAIMLSKRDGERVKMPVFRASVFLLFLFVMVMYVGAGKQMILPGDLVEGSVGSLGLLIFTEHVLAFEVISLILLAAMIGAIYMAKKEVAK